MNDTYKSGSLTLAGSVAMGTGVMIGAGIFALTGQVAEYAGPLFPVAFLLAAVISAFSAYSYIKVSNKYPSAGGIAMILQKAYGKAPITGAAALLMALSMIINESLVARTFGTYTMQLFDAQESGVTVAALGVGLLIAAFLVNIAGNRAVGNLSKVTAALKIGGILVLAIGVLWASGVSMPSGASAGAAEGPRGGFLAGVALAILAYKGFTTITNSGGEVVNPEKNVGRSIIASLIICVAVYLLVAFAVSSALSLDEIVQAKNYSLAEAARPAFGDLGVWFTVAIAIVATASGVLASMFAVSRMLAMLTEMQLIPHSHFGMPGGVQKHTLVYTVVVASLLAAFFDLSRIASLGAILYLCVDISIHWGVYRHMREDVGARASILVTAIVLDTLVLAAFLVTKGGDDPLIVVVAVSSIVVVFLFERFYLSRLRPQPPSDEGGHMHG